MLKKVVFLVADERQGSAIEKMKKIWALRGNSFFMEVRVIGKGKVWRNVQGRIFFL